MPHYYFNCTDGNRFFADGDGVDLPDNGAARRYAFSTARDLWRKRLPSNRNWSGWRIEVTGERGRAVLTVPFSDPRKR